MGAVAAAIIVRKERELVEQFQQARATSAETAQSLTQLGVHDEGVAWRRLTRRAVVREGKPGLYYLDEPSWTALRFIRRRLAIVMVSLVIVAALGAWLVAH
ncbi:MAG: hypothetical protein ABI679_10560 [Gemmatimonadota bacterium]